MEREAGRNRQRWVGTPFFRMVAKVLVFLMAIQIWPLWEFSQSYELDLDRLPRTLNRVISLLSLGKAQASSLLFGPKKYIRTTGKPNVYKDSFSATPGKGWLIILNGEEDGQHRVSSAIITLNGKDLLKTKDFNQNVYRLRTTVDLSSKNNLVVELRSKPNSYLWIEITAALANQAPVANAGPDQTVSVGQTVTLNGSGSADADGDPLTYRWTFPSKPTGSAASLSDSAAVKPTFIADKAGSYTLQLIVNDGYVDSPPDTVTITTQNTPPVANAGPDQTVYVTNLVTLNGSGSTDVDGNLLTYQWSMILWPSGSAATLSDPAGMNPTFTVDKPGTYAFQLIVNDGLVNSAPDIVTVTTLNTPPVANAGPDQSVFVGQTVTLDGSGSTDVDGNPLSFLWSLTTTPLGSLAVLSDYLAVYPSFKVDKPGSYVAQLIVNDGLVDSLPDTVTITTQNSPPVAEAGPNQSVFVGSPISLDGSASTDVDGDLLTFSWSLLSGPSGSSSVLANPTTVNPSFTVDKAGNYVAQLIVNDGTVNSAPDTVTISTLNSPPVANAGPDQSTLVGHVVTLNGSASTDVDGDSLTFSWSFTVTPDGSSATLVNPTTVNPNFTVDKPGTYVVQLIVSDGIVNSAPDTVSISTVNSAPVANAGPDQTDVTVGSSVTLDGSASSDADGDTLTYSWSFTWRPTGSSASLAGANTVHPTFVIDKPGTYVAQLIVNDGTVDSAPDTTVITTTNRKPIASAGPDQAVIVNSLVTLNGTASSDIDGDPLTYHWTLIAAPPGSSASLVNATSVAPSFTPNVIGTYEVELIVNDGTVDSAPDTVSVVVSPLPNRAPVAANDSYEVDEDVTLNVPATGVLGNDTDPDGNALSAILVSPPATGSLNLNPNGSFTYALAANFHGQVTFTYQASDGALTSNTATVTITVRPVNHPPVANAGPDQLNVPAGSTVTLDGSGSADIDGDHLTYTWSFVSRPEGSVATFSNSAVVSPTFTADKPGTYIAQLIVNDGTFSSAPDTVNIVAVITNQPPVAKNLSINMADTTPATIILKGTDPDGDALTFSTTTNPSHGTLSGAPPLLTYTPQQGYLGSDSFIYEANDGKGGIGTATVTINVCWSTNGLVAYYPFNGNTNDESGSGNNGTVSGAMLVADRDTNPESAYSFDGVNDFIHVGASASLQMTNALSIDVWIYPMGSGSSATQGGVIAGKEGEYLVARFPDGTIRLAFGNTNGWTDWTNTSWINSGYVAPLNRWTHIVVVYDAGVIRTYADGALVHSFNGSAPIKDAIDNLNTFRIGNRELYNLQNFDGIIDEVRIYNRAVSGSEVACVASTTTNNSPHITSMPLTAAGMSYEYTYQVIADDPDGDILTYSLPEAPAGMSIDQAGFIRWTPDTASDFRISVQVTDGYGGMDTQDFWIRVGKGNSPAANSPPMAHAGDDFTMDEGKQDQLDGSHSFDAEGDHLTYTWTQVAGPVVELDNSNLQKPRFTAPLVDKNTVMTFELVVNDGAVDSTPAKVNVMVLNTDIWPDGSGMVINCNPDGPGSLKAAVDYANTHPGTRITFSIPDTEPCYGINTPGVWSLRVPVYTSGAYLIGITLDADGTFFDGASQTENQGDRNPFGPEIEITEDNVHAWPFRVAANNVVVRGVVINRQPILPGHAPTLHVAAGEHVVVVGNYIGTDATGTVPVSPNLPGDCSAHGGLMVMNGPTFDYTKKSLIHNLRIGGSRPGEGNLISVFSTPSIYFSTMYDGSAYNQPLDAPGPITIQGNLIGVDRTGSQLLPNACPVPVISILQARDVLIGGVTSGSRNIIGGGWQGINILDGFTPPFQPSGNIEIQGNYIGTDVTGMVALANTDGGIVIYPGDSVLPAGIERVIGGSIPGAGNVIVSNGNGIRIYDERATYTSVRIQGNFVGTNTTGTSALGNGADGITINGGRVSVGGTGLGEGNVIGGQRGSGIVVLGTNPTNPVQPSLIEVKGNRIGVGADGLTPIPNQNGVAVASYFPIVIGGTEPGAENTIAYNQGIGVYFPVLDYGNFYGGHIGRVLGNRIFGNGGRGIQRGDGTTNDPGDADLSWPFYRQNYPVINTVEVINGATRITGILDTQSPEQCLVEIFANSAADPSGFGEGEQWVAALYPLADKSFIIPIPQDLSGKYLAATATRMTPLGGYASSLNSSEFSPAVLVGSFPSTNMPPVISSIPVTSATSETPYSYQVIAYDPEGRALRYSLALAPSGMAISATGLVTWRPTIQQEGTQVVTIVVYDPEGLYASQNFTIQVLPLVDILPPTVSPSLPADLVVSTPYTLTGTICDSHLVWYGIEVAPVGTNNYILMAEGNTCVTNGILGTLDPTRLANGLYNIRITAYDQENHLTVYNTPEPIEVKGKLKIGQFSLAFQDISVPVSGIPINVIRSYNSFNKKQGDFGIGWDMSLGTGDKIQVTRPLGAGWLAEEDGYWLGTLVYKLVNDRPAKILVTYADGKQDRFQFAPDFVVIPRVDPTWVSPIIKPLEGTTSTLDVPGMAQPVLCPSQYCPSGSGIMDVDPDNADIFAIYDPDLFRLTTAEGMVLMLSKTEGLKSISDRNGNTVTFSPSGIAHSAGLSIDMQRDFKNRVTKITDPMGLSVSYLYNANDDLAAFTDQAGNVTRFGYDIDHNLTNIIDPRGIEIMKTQYDAEGRMIGTVDGLDKTTEVTHDTANATEYVKDRNGFTTIYRYDTDGNVITMTDPLGNTTHYTYDANGNQLSKTDPLGNTWTWTYDANNNKLSETDPLGNTKQWTYNSNNQILTDTDALGRVISYQYDAKGNLLKKTDAMGKETTHAYDWRGNRTSTTDCSGTTTTYEYNAAGYKTKETDALGNVTTYTYDGNGNELTMTKTRTAETGPVTMTTTKEYNSTGQLVRQTDPDGSVTVTEYNSLRKKSASVDKRGSRTTYEYDAAGNLTRTIYPDNTIEVNTYDGNGNRVTYTDRAGATTTFQYEPVKYDEDERSTQNRLIRTTFADGGSTRIEYDAAGRISATIDENGNRTSSEYDAAGRITRTIDALGQVTTFTYDATGNQLSVTDANGNTTGYQYDALNRKTKVMFPDGTFTATAYAGCGTKQKASETDQAGNTTSFAYDALGRLVRVTDAMGGQTTYTYDEVGNKFSQTDPNGHTTTWAYDNMGRVTKRTLPLGMSETFTYDAYGNVLTKTDCSGSTITHIYDVMNRLTTKAYPNASQVTYTYTPNGRRKSVIDPRGTTTYTYGLKEMLTRVTNPDGSTLEYTYDLKGNRTSVRIASGTTNYTYDSLNRLVTVTDPDGNVTTYTYDSVGNRASITYPNGTMTGYQYDTLNRLTYLENRKTAGGVISSYAYTLGPNGNRTKVTENTGRVVNYIYDTLNRLTEEQITDSILGNQTISYTYDAFGNRQTKTDGSGTTTYIYNANDQLITETAPAYTATYEYDPNGNTVKKTQGGTITAYAYDFENRLMASQTGGQQVSYEYDADGIRTKATTDTGITKYVVDKNMKYAQVLEERDGSNSLVVSYLHGDDLISQKRGASLSYYHYDGQMSTRKLSDSSGSSTDSYVYDAFGILLDRQGSTPNNYLYTGEQYDPNIGFYYLRARYLNPIIGRFIVSDQYPGNISDPISLHKYLYGHGNPVNRWDPSGQLTMAQLVQVSVIVGILAGLVAMGASVAESPYNISRHRRWFWIGVVVGTSVAMVAFYIVAPPPPPGSGGTPRITHVTERTVNLTRMGYKPVTDAMALPTPSERADATNRFVQYLNNQQDGDTAIEMLKVGADETLKSADSDGAQVITEFKGYL